MRKGTYALFVYLDSDTESDVGSLGKIFFGKGVYCYVGSAMCGLDQRLGRHLRRGKKVRWHIDRLTEICSSAEAWESYPDFIPECDLASAAA